MSLTDIIRWIVAGLGAMSGAILVIRLITEIVKLVKESLDAAEKATKLADWRRENKERQALIVPGTKEEFDKAKALAEQKHGGIVAGVAVSSAVFWALTALKIDYGKESGARISFQPWFTNVLLGVVTTLCLAIWLISR